MKKAAGDDANGFQILVPGAGIEPARLAAGDFESVIYSVSTGKWGEF